MAIIFSDGFDSNNPYYSGKYDTYDGTIPTTPTGRTGNAAQYRLGYATKNLSTNYSTLVIGFAYKVVNLGDTKTILKLIDGSTNQVYLATNSSNQIEVRQGNDTLLGTSTSTISDTNWTYIELKVVINNSGSFDLRINGYSESSGSTDTQNTANSYANKVALGNDSSFNDLFDDYYIDSTEFLGTVKIYTINPSADSSVAWTPNTGSNYQCVSDSPYQDGDTTYVSATNINIKDLYDLENLNLSSGVIKGIVHNFTGKKTDLNPTNIQPIIKTNGSEYTATSQSMTTSYLNYQAVWETNPNTGLSWTYNEIDSLIAGMQTA